MPRMNREAKKLFLEIHQEYESQVPTIRGESEYTHELLTLQKALLNQEIEIEDAQKQFEVIKTRQVF